MLGTVRILFCAGLLVASLHGDPLDAQSANPGRGARFGKSPAGERLSQLGDSRPGAALPEELRQRIAARRGELLRNTTESGLSRMRDRRTAGTGPAPSTPTLSPSPALTIDDQIHLELPADIFKDGVPFLWGNLGSVGVGLSAGRNSFGSTTSVGYRAGIVTGPWSTAAGREAGYGTAYFATSVGAYANYFSYGDASTSIGFVAGYRTFSNANTSMGFAAGYYNVLGSDYNGGRNTAIGAFSQFVSQGGLHNTSVGYYALASSQAITITTGPTSTAPAPRPGSSNTAIGAFALTPITPPLEVPFPTVPSFVTFTGSHNVAVGFNAGGYFASGGVGSHNIHINNPGIPTDQATIRIGSTFNNLYAPPGPGAPGGTFIYGVFFPPYTQPSGYFPMCVGPANRIITCEGSLPNGAVSLDVGDTGSLRERLQALRPVSYDGEAGEPSETEVRLGLLAGEVAEVLPELVKFTPDGEPGRVDYKLLASLLLNELQHQAKELDRQTRELDRQASLNASQQAELETLRVLRAELAELRELEARLIRLEAAAEEPRHALASTGN